MTAEDDGPGDSASPGRWAATVRRIRPGLHLVEARLEGFDVRAVVIVEGDGAMVWDTLAHPRQMEAAGRLTEGREVQMVYSHADWDHVWGAAGVSGVVEVLAHEACARRFEEEAPSELEKRRTLEPSVWDAVALVPPTRVFGLDAQVEVGGLEVRLHHLPGHTPDCCVAWIPDRGVLLAGDTVETPLPVVNDAEAVPAWVEHLRRWESQEGLTTVVPAHGPVGGPERVGETAVYLEALLEGREPDISSGLQRFYRRTHRDNLARFGLA